ncbi:unnamed protein product, partial [Closterium sp. NIES-53]
VSAAAVSTSTLPLWRSLGSCALTLRVRTASEFLTAIKARYATPTSVSLGRLFLPFLFPDLASFERTADLTTHLCSLDSSYRAACTDTQLALVPPPMAITIYFIATSLPGRLASVRDALLPKHPSELTIEVLEPALKDVESNLCLVASASGAVPPPLFHGCIDPQLPTFTTSLATAATDVTAAAVTTSSRSWGRSGKRGGRGAGGGGGGAGGGDARVHQPPIGMATAGGGAAAWYLTQQQQQQQLPLPSQQPQQQQRNLAGARRGQACGRSHPPGQCFAQLTVTLRAACGVDGPAPDWLPLVQTYGPALWGMSASQLVDLLGNPHAMYAVVDSSAFDSIYSSVFSLGASLAEDFRALHCFFRERMALTPLPTPVSLAIADPTSGPVTARYTTTLPCLAIPFGSLIGFHLPSFSRNLVGVRPLVSQHMGVWIEPSGKAAVCVDGDTYAPLATFTAEPGSGLYTLHTGPRGQQQQQQQLLPPTPVTVPRQVAASPQVAVSGQVPVSGPVAASCSYKSLANPTVLWHHRMGHPSISRLRAMSRQRLVLGLPRVLPSLPPSFVPPCGPCVEGRMRATPHSSSLRTATKPFETLHLDVWGPASRPGPERESFCLVVVDDHSCYTTVFPLTKKSDMTSTLIRWLLTTADNLDRRVSCIHSDRGGLVMEIARTSTTHARAPHFLWPYVVQHAGHQLNLWPRVSRPEVSPTSLWTGSPGAASRFHTWGCLALVRDTSADKISPRAVPYVFLGFPEDSYDDTLYHPPLPSSLTLVKSPTTSGAAGVGARGERVGAAADGATTAGGAAAAAPGAGAAAAVSTAVGAAAATAVGGAAVAAAAGAAAAATSSSYLWSSDPRSPLSFSSLPPSPPISGPPLPPPDPSPAIFDSNMVSEQVDPPGSILWMGPLLASVAVLPIARLGCTPFSCLPRAHGMRHLAHGGFLPIAPPWCPRDALPCPSCALCLPRSSPSVLPSPPESALTASLSNPVTDYYRTYRIVLSRVLASLVTDPRASLSSVSALTAAVTKFASPRCLDYATSLVAAPPSSPLAVVGELDLGCDALEDRQFELEFLAAASPHLCAMLLTHEGDPDALDIPTPRTYAEAVSGPWASQWRAAMDSEMASYRSTGTYARYVARGFSQREGVDFFQTFAPTPKMTTLWVLLHVAAQRDYELHSLDFPTAFLQGSLHEEVWLHHPSAFTGTFPPRTQWRLRQPPSSADPSLIVRRGSTPFFVLVYVDDPVFATADRVALADMKGKL